MTDMSAEANEIERWFAHPHRRYVLFVRETPAGYTAVYFPESHKGGPVPSAWGETALAAAESAQAEFIAAHPELA